MKRKTAFTMIEMIFVIVILGIVASIGSSIIAKIYENYIYSKTINELQSKTETTLEEIAKRLSFRVKGATIARFNSSPESSDIKALQDANDSYQILEWIGDNYEGFEGNSSGPGWSGFIDLDSSETNQTQIKTSGSDLSYATDIIYALSNGDVNLSSPSSSVGLLYPGIPDDFNVTKYGWNDWTGAIHHEYVFKVQQTSKDILKFTENDSNTTYEHYRLSWSAYALVPKGNDGDYNLTLYYNYRPWMGEKYEDASHSIIATNVNVFKFVEIGNVIRLKLCLFKKIGNDFNISFCKEKAVF